MNNDKTISMDLMKYAAGQACDVLRILANEDRLLLLCQLSQGEKAVSELEEALGIHQPTLSQQLAVLRSDGLVNTAEKGNAYFIRSLIVKYWHCLKCCISFIAHKRRRAHDYRLG